MKISLPKIDFLAVFKSFFQKIKTRKPKYNKKNILMLFGVICVFIILSLIFSYFSADKPVIKLITPKENNEVTGEEVLVKGSTSPIADKVIVNGIQASLNGDGLFTAVIKIQPGKTLLTITASKGIKKSQILNLIERKLTPEEEEIRSQQLAQKQRQEKLQAESIDQKIAEINSMYENNAAKKVKIVNSSVDNQGSFNRIIGEVVNATGKPAQWVKVTATFYNEQQSLIDTKIGYVVSGSEILSPNAIGKFKTQSIQQSFSSYKLDVKWEEKDDTDQKTATSSSLNSTLPN